MKFKSLDILSDGISYIQTAIARISGLMLMLGLIVAMANLLQDDSVFLTAPWLQAWWAWSQSIAVDSGLALVFVRLFEAIAARNKPKTWSYGVIGGMLAFVAITITSIESIRQVRSEEHTSELQSPDHLVCRLLLEKKKKRYDMIKIC